MREHIKIFCDKLLKDVQVSYKVNDLMIGGRTKYELGKSSCLNECKHCYEVMKECIEISVLDDFQNKYAKA